MKQSVGEHIAEDWACAKAELHSTTLESGEVDRLKHLLRRAIGLIERGQVSAVDHETREVVLRDAYDAVAVEEQGWRGRDDGEREAVELTIGEKSSLFMGERIKRQNFTVLPQTCPKCGDHLIHNNRGIECGALRCDYAATSLIEVEAGTE